MKHSQDYMLQDADDQVPAAVACACTVMGQNSRLLWSIVLFSKGRVDQHTYLRRWTVRFQGCASQIERILLAAWDLFVSVTIPTALH